MGSPEEKQQQPMMPEEIVAFKGQLRNTEVIVIAAVCGMLALSKDEKGFEFPDDETLEEARTGRGLSDDLYKMFEDGSEMDHAGIIIKSAVLGMVLRQSMDMPDAGWCEDEEAPAPEEFKSTYDRVVELNNLTGYFDNG